MVFRNRFDSIDTLVRRFVSTTPENDAMPKRALSSLAYVNITVDALHLQPSSFSCDDRDQAHQICIFKNVIVHQGWLLYIVEDEAAAAATKLPNPAIFSGRPLPGLSVPDRMRVMPLKDVTALLAAAVEISSEGQSVQFAEFPNAIFERVRSYRHWFWAVNGISNLYVHMCKHLGACTPEEVQSTAILRGVGYPGRPTYQVGPGMAIEAVSDLLECFGPVIRVNHPASSGESIADNHVVLFRRLLVGIGDEVVQPESAKEPGNDFHYNRPNASLLLERVRYLRRCAGLPGDPAPLTGASILLVNRPHDDGRHIIGLDDVYDRLIRNLRPDIKVRLYYPRAESMSAQAAVFASHNIVVVPHGSANANLAFLPRTAIVFALYAVRHRHSLEIDHVKALPNPPYNVSLVGVDCREATQPNVIKVQSKFERFAKADAEGQIALLGNAKMNEAKSKALKKYLGVGEKDWMKAVGYVPDTQRLAADIANAATQMHLMLQQQ